MHFVLVHRAFVGAIKYFYAPPHLVDPAGLFIAQLLFAKVGNQVDRLAIGGKHDQT